jgi:hypothetical protein
MAVPTGYFSELRRTNLMTAGNWRPLIDDNFKLPHLVKLLKITAYYWLDQKCLQEGASQPLIG